MALFKVFSGLEQNLPQELTPGAIYFTTDTYKMFVDLLNGERILMASGEQVPLVPLYPEDIDNPYKGNQDSSGFLPGYQDIKEY